MDCPEYFKQLLLPNIEILDQGESTEDGLDVHNSEEFAQHSFQVELSQLPIIQFQSFIDVAHEGQNGVSMQVE